MEILTRRSIGLGAGAAPAFGAKPSFGRPVWPGQAKAAVSLTYDDSYDSQLDNVGPLLEELGLKATFFLTIENMDARRADWVTLASKGHEISNHTMTHPCELGGYSPERFLHEQIEPAEHYLDANFGRTTPRCYAYPCGVEGIGQGSPEQQHDDYENILKPIFLAARTVTGVPNDPKDVLKERFLLNAFERPTKSIIQVSP